MTAKVETPTDRLSTGKRIVALVLLALLGLGVWLIVTGLRGAIGLGFQHDTTIFGILAIAAGALIILRR